MAGGRSFQLLAQKRAARQSGEDDGRSPHPLPREVRAASTGGEGTPTAEGEEGVRVTVAIPPPSAARAIPPRPKRTRPSNETPAEEQDENQMTEQNSVWDKDLSKSLEKLLLTDADKDRLLTASENEIKKTAFHLERWCLRGASLALLLQEQPGLIASGSRDEEIRLLKTKLAESDASVAQLTNDLQLLTQDLNKESKQKEEAQQKCTEAIDQAKKLKEEWAAEKLKNDQELARKDKMIEKLTKKALKHKKEAVKNFNMFDKTTDESFKNAVLQLSFLNQGIGGGIRILGADPLHQVIQGKLVDHRREGAEVDLSAPDLPNPLNLRGCEEGGDSEEEQEEEVEVEPLSPVSD